MTPREQGAQAFRERVPLMDNPYTRYSTSWREWEEGWQAEWFSLTRIPWSFFANPLPSPPQNPQRPPRHPVLTRDVNY